jgi:hypothetical protein
MEARDEHGTGFGEGWTGGMTEEARSITGVRGTERIFPWASWEQTESSCPDPHAARAPAPNARPGTALVHARGEKLGQVRKGLARILSFTSSWNPGVLS